MPEKRGEPILCFIEFRSMNGLQKFENAMKISCLKRAFLICLWRKDEFRHKYLDGEKWPKFSAPPEPSLIIWENLGVSKVSQLIRRGIINVLSIIVTILGFYGVSRAKSFIETEAE